jgi:site-specific recombinase XerD
MKQTFTLDQVRIEGHRQIVLFRTHPQQPVLVPFIYLVLFLKRKSLSTVTKKFLAVKLLYEHFATLNHDLDELIINSKTQTVDRHLEEFLQNFCNYSPIAFETKRSYLYNIAEFLNWAFNRYSKRKEDIQVMEYVGSFSRNLPSSISGINHSLDENNVQQILNFSRPDNVNNPFKKFQRHRNSLIIDLLLVTGIRLGELLKLKSTDIHEHDGRHYIEVLNREDEDEDTRADEPALKNHQSERTISISDTLYQSIQSYILHFRRPTRNGLKFKLKHGYLLTSDRGSPLSKSSVYAIIERLTKVVNENSKIKIEKIAPHSFRHFFAENFLKYLIETCQLDMERAKDELRTICGWSINSNMPSYYTKKYLSEKANRTNLERIDRVYSKMHGKI